MTDRQRQWIATAAAMVLLASAPLATAQTPAEQPGPSSRLVGNSSDGLGAKKLPARGAEGDGSTGGEWLKMLLALAVVVALIFLARVLLKRVAPMAGMPGGSDVLEVLARAPLTARHQMILVRMGQRLVLVGCGPQGLSTLSEVVSPQEAEKLVQAVEASRSARSFAAVFRRKGGHLKGPSEPRKPEGPKA